MSAQLQPLQPLHTQPLSQQLQQPTPQQQHLYLQAAPANSCSPAEQHAAPSTGAPSPAPATFAHTQPPPTAIPYHIYQVCLILHFLELSSHLDLAMGTDDDLKCL